MTEKKQFHLLQLSETQRNFFATIRSADAIAGLSAEQFVLFCGHLYQQSGYTVYRAWPPETGSVDLLLRDGPQVTVVECLPGLEIVEQLVLTDLYSTMIHNEAQQAAAITTGRFSAETETWSTNIPIDLVDGRELELWAQQMPLQPKAISAPPPKPASVQPAATTTPPPATKQRKRPSGWIIVALVLAAVLFACSGITIIAYNNFASILNPAPLPTAISSISDATDEPAATATSDADPAPTVTLATEPTAETPTVTTPDVIAKRVTTPLAIDGNLDDWSAEIVYAAPFVAEREDSWDGSMDIDSAWQLAWDDEHFYLAVRVFDDTHVQTQEAKSAYLGDSIELQFDTDIEADYGREISEDDFQYVVSAGDFGRIAPGVFRFQGDGNGLMSDAPGTTARVAAVQQSNGYTLEIAIPWTDIGVNATPGMTIGAALSINDNDDPGTAKQELMLSHVVGRRWLDPTSWGTLTLE
ncbi:MAG: restriction endonuclease [Anaerolineae bacterium]|nr:restriction endonuclease [Anaerolineae bacterium]